MNDAAWHDSIQVDHNYGAKQLERHGQTDVSQRLCKQWRYMRHVTGMSNEEIGLEDGFSPHVVQTHTGGMCGHE